MNHKLSPRSILFVAIMLIASLACSLFTPKGETSYTPPTVAAPAAQAQTATCSYKVSGKTVTVFSNDTLIAKVVFTSNFVDNNPSEWLKGRAGVCYLYQSGVGNNVTFEVTLYAGGTFAIDGDWAKYANQDLGIVNNSADFMAFADQPGSYKLSGSTIGLAIGIVKDENDKAGYVYTDRNNATGNDGRPIYFLNLNGGAAQINK
jgi:hypothetical protein